MVEYNKVNVKLSDTQLEKLKNAVKNETGTTLRTNLKMFNGNNFPHELLLTIKQKAKVKNAFNNNNISTDLKISRAQVSKIIQSFSKKCFSSIRNNSCYFGNWCWNLKKYMVLQIQL